MSHEAAQRLAGIFEGGTGILLLLVVVAILPIFNGKSLIQILMDMLIPQPEATPAERRIATARQAAADDAEQRTVAAMQAEAVKRRIEAIKAALPASMSVSDDTVCQMAAEELASERPSGGILDWITKLIPGLSSLTGMLPILAIGVVVFMVMSGGCDGGCDGGGCDLGCDSSSSRTPPPVAVEADRSVPTYHVDTQAPGGPVWTLVEQPRIETLVGGGHPRE